MYKRKLVSVLMLAPLTVFIGCVPSANGLATGLTDLTKSLTQNNKVTDTNSSNGGDDTAMQSAIGGAVTGGVLTFLKTGNYKKALVGAVLAGTAGYFIGQKLSAMQKNYKGQENTLLSNIIQIDEETKSLKTKNEELSSSITTIESKVTQLQKDKLLKTTQKEQFTSELNEKKTGLRALLNKNETLAKQIASSKSQVNEYEYKAEDKKEILNSVDILASNAKKSTNTINAQLSSIDKILATLA